MQVLGWRPGPGPHPAGPPPLLRPRPGGHPLPPGRAPSPPPAPRARTPPPGPPGPPWGRRPCGLAPGVAAVAATPAQTRPHTRPGPGPRQHVSMCVASAPGPMDDFLAEYRSELGELTLNSKAVINNLTMLASENLPAAAGITAAIENHIFTVCTQSPVCVSGPGKPASGAEPGLLPPRSAPQSTSSTRSTSWTALSRMSASPTSTSSLEICRRCGFMAAVLVHLATVELERRSLL